MNIESLADRIARRKAEALAAATPQEQPVAPTIPTPEPEVKEAAPTNTEARASMEALILAFSKLSLEDKAKIKELLQEPATIAVLHEVAQTEKTTEPQSPAVQELTEAVVKPLSLAEKLALKKAQQSTSTLLAPVEQQLAEETPYDIGEKMTTETPSAGITVPDTGTDSLEKPVLETAKSSLWEKIRLRKEAEALANVPKQFRPEPEVQKKQFALDIKLNAQQAKAVVMAGTGQSFCLTGSAGSGKTTSERGMLKAIKDSGTTRTTNFKIVGDGARVTAPSVAVVAATNKAAGNSARAILSDPELKEFYTHNIMSIHALLEFVPEFYMEDGVERFRFAPTRTAHNPLDLTHLIVEESTLVGLDIWDLVVSALPEDCVIIFVGDINQLQPVFGPSVLNFASTRLPVINLHEVYRQAEGSPIINNAYRILQGDSIIPMKNPNGEVQVIEGSNQFSVPQAKMCRSLFLHPQESYFAKLIEAGLYDPDQDMILSPYNVQALGTENVNKTIANLLSLRAKAVVFHVIAGFHQYYLAVGDKVMYNKESAVIVDIKYNSTYFGRLPHPPSPTMNRFGFDTGAAAGLEELDAQPLKADYTNFSIDSAKEDDANTKASHHITLMFESGSTMTLSSAKDMNPSVFGLGYALTVHKSQGSEWRNVFMLFHSDFIGMLNRELIYTAMTRAREKAFFFAKQPILLKAVKSQRLVGNTIEEKIANFNKKVLEDNKRPCYLNKTEWLKSLPKEETRDESV